MSAAVAGAGPVPVTIKFRIGIDDEHRTYLDAGRIAPGAPADLVVFDPQAPPRVSAQGLKSQGRNSPFLGHELVGRVRATVVAGKVVYEA